MVIARTNSLREKTCRTSLLWTIEVENDTVPQVGDIVLAVHHLNQPDLICRNTQVEIVPYNQVTAQYAAIEDEGDGSLTYWREAHRDFSRASVNASDENSLKPCRWYVRYLSY